MRLGICLEFGDTYMYMWPYKTRLMVMLCCWKICTDKVYTGPVIKVTPHCPMHIPARQYRWWDLTPSTKHFPHFLYHIRVILVCRIFF